MIKNLKYYLIGIIFLLACMPIQYYSLPKNHNPKTLVSIYGFLIEDKGFLKPDAHFGVLYIDGVLIQPNQMVLQITPGKHTLTVQYSEGGYHAEADFSYNFKSQEVISIKGEVVEKKKSFLGAYLPKKVAIWLEDKSTGRLLTDKLIKPVMYTSGYKPMPTYLENGDLAYM